jgi:UDP-N-acetylmuramoyl-tripeptide--D-alanyl-D-alanine ligase
VPVHIEYFKDIDALMEEKAFLLKALREDGTAILNADDENILALGKYVKGNVIHYGMEKPATINADKYELMYDGDSLAGMQFRILYESNIIPVVLKGVVGIQHVYPVLASACVGFVIKMPLVKITESFLNHEYPRGRMNLISGIKSTVIIDDTYNSSPVALEFALKTLKEVLAKGRKIAVLGDMLELGSHSSNSHKEGGKLVALCADILITVGVRARDFKESALESKMAKNCIHSFSTATEAGEFLKDFIKEGDVILVKGSQSMRMEKAVALILEDKENIKKLLVRQEREWQKR